MMGTRCTGRSRNLVLVYDIGCFIPARKGSERVKNKNLRPLGGVPLVEIAILQALTLFDPKQVYLSTDSDEIYEYTTKYGLGNLPKRPARFSRADSPDIQWVLHAIESLGDLKPRGFMILRPTNPFRSAKMLHDAASIRLKCGKLRVTEKRYFRFCLLCHWTGHLGIASHTKAFQKFMCKMQA